MIYFQHRLLKCERTPGFQSLNVHKGRKVDINVKPLHPQVVTHTFIFSSLIIYEHTFWTIYFHRNRAPPSDPTQMLGSREVRVHRRACIFMRGLWLDLCVLQPLTRVYPHMLLAREWCSGAPLIFSACTCIMLWQKVELIFIHIWHFWRVFPSWGSGQTYNIYIYYYIFICQCSEHNTSILMFHRS